MDGTGNLFKDLIEALPSDMEATVIRYPKDRIQSYVQLLQLLELSLPSSAPFVLVAESFSTPLAIQWSATSRANLKGLVICAGFAASPLRGWLRHLCLLLSPIAFSVHPPDIAIEHFLVGRTASKSVIIGVKQAIASVSPKVLVARFRSALTCDARSALSAVDAPILLIGATEDELIGSKCMKEMRDLRPDAAVEMISGPHLLFQVRARTSAEAIAKYARQFSIG